jgi:hypothetical protein
MVVSLAAAGVVTGRLGARMGLGDAAGTVK